MSNPLPSTSTSTSTSTLAVKTEINSLNEQNEQIDQANQITEGEDLGVSMSTAAQDLESILRSYENDLNCRKEWRKENWELGIKIHGVVNPDDFDMNMEEVDLKEFEDVLAQSVSHL